MPTRNRKILNEGPGCPLEAPAYPGELDAWWRERARRAVGHREQASAVDALVRAAAGLSDGFTSERQAGFSGYADDERRLLAYGLFFFPRSYVRTQLVLAECPARARAADRGEPFRILDVGAGTGAAGLAAAEWLIASGAAPAAELTAVDPSAVSLGLLRELHGDHAGGRFARCTLRTEQARLESLPPGGGRYDLVLLSLVLNETEEGRDGTDAADRLRGLLDLLRDDGRLLVMEPGTRDAATCLHGLRDTLLASRTASVVAPCLHAAPCPMLGLRDAWCHEVRKWRVPPAARRIAQRLDRDIEFLRFTFLALAPRGPKIDAPGDADRARLVAPVRPLNGRMQTIGCAADGRLHTYEWLTRGTTGAERKALRTIERGDLLALHDLAPVGGGERLRAGHLVRETGFRH